MSGIPKSQQRLLTGLHELKMGRSLSDYNIRDSINMTVLLRIRGGMNTGEVMGGAMAIAASPGSDLVSAAAPVR